MINYQTIADATRHYEQCGFKRIEAPWTVTKEVSDITKPKGAKEFQLVHDNGKVLVASAEQSFLYLYLKGFLPKGRFQATTPCFRNENFDSLHTKYFIKTELIDTEDVTVQGLTDMLMSAREFFMSQFGPEIHLRNHTGTIEVVKTDVEKFSYDLMIEGIELGSYGIRECDHLKWIYGTGVAEPRLSMVKKKIGYESK
jgi:hypothetical protein